MKLSYVVVSYNRRDRLLDTLDRLARTTPLPRAAYEIIVVDNASTDGSADAVTADFPSVRLIRSRRNRGMAGRNLAFDVARGDCLVSLDDDSYPLDDAVTRSMDYLDAHRDAAVVVGRVELPGGGCEAPAMPAVMLGGASCIRRAAIEDAGGFDPAFFRQAEEYDLSCRLWSRGWRVARFEDVRYHHAKVPTNRPGDLTHRMDIRNNAIVAERFLPVAARRAYRRDWSHRYGRLARCAGAARASREGREEARRWERREAIRRRAMNDAAFEAVFDWRRQAGAIAAWSLTLRDQRVVIADYAKNLYATYRGCRAAGLDVLAVADDHPAYRGASYRGVPMLPLEDAARLRPAGVVLANVNPAQVDARTAAAEAVFDAPVLRLWEPRRLGARDHSPLESAA